MACWNHCSTSGPTQISPLLWSLSWMSPTVLSEHVSQPSTELNDCVFAPFSILWTPARQKQHLCFSAWPVFSTLPAVEEIICSICWTALIVSAYLPSSPSISLPLLPSSLLSFQFSFLLSLFLELTPRTFNGLFKKPGHECASQDSVIFPGILCWSSG